MYVFGGRDNSGQSVGFAQQYDPIADRWLARDELPALAEARGGMGSAPLLNGIVILLLLLY
jgi:hypothetical protein